MSVDDELLGEEWEDPPGCFTVLLVLLWLAFIYFMWMIVFGGQRG